MSRPYLPAGPQLAELIAQTATELQLSPDLVDAVVRYQFKTISEVTGEADIIEVTGLGYFNVSRHRLQLALRRLQKICQSYEERLGNETNHSKVQWLLSRIDSCRDQIQKYQSRIIGYESRLERLNTGNV